MTILASSQILASDVNNLGAALAAGDVLNIYADTERNSVGAASWTMKKEIAIGHGGTLRIKFDLKTINVVNNAKAKIYKNGVAVGTEQSTNSNVYATYSEDLAGWLPGDLVQLYVYNAVANMAYIRNFRLYASKITREVVMTD